MARKEKDYICKKQKKVSKDMKDKELRSSDVNVKFIENFENNKIYPLDIFDNNVYVRKQI